MGLTLASFTLLGQVIVILILISYFTHRTPVVKFLAKNAFLFSFLIVASASLGSLFYSEIIGFEPCKLCWYQRVFMYPQVIIFGIALWKKKWNNHSIHQPGPFVNWGYYFALPVSFANGYCLFSALSCA